MTAPDRSQHSKKALTRGGRPHLPLNFHPVATRVPVFDTPEGADVATSDRRSWSGLRSRSPVAMRLAAYSAGVRVAERRMPASTIVETGLENAHRTACGEVLYWLHPWFGREVFIHDAIDKIDGVVFRCSVDGSNARAAARGPRVDVRSRCMRVRSQLYFRPHRQSPSAQRIILPARSGVEGYGDHRKLRFRAHPESLTTRIRERPMARKTTASVSGDRRKRLAAQQMDLFARQSAAGAPS